MRVTDKGHTLVHLNRALEAGAKWEAEVLKGDDSDEQELAEYVNGQLQRAKNEMTS